MQREREIIVCRSPLLLLSLLLLVAVCVLSLFTKLVRYFAVVMCIMVIIRRTVSSMTVIVVVAIMTCSRPFAIMTSKYYWSDISLCISIDASISTRNPFCMNGEQWRGFPSTDCSTPRFGRNGFLR